MTEKTTINAACESCPVHQAAYLQKLGVNMQDWDYVVNPGRQPPM